jgi:hypothetical protein
MKEAPSAYGVDPALAPNWLPDSTKCFMGPFRTNVIAFLRGHATKVALPGLRKIQAWVVRMEAKQLSGRPLLLHIYEERLSDETSTICDPCRNMGGCLAARAWRGCHVVGDTALNLVPLDLSR